MTSLRYETEVRQLGGLMLVLSLAVMVFPMFDTTNRISLDITEDPIYNGDSALNILNWVLLVGDLCVIALGLLGMAIGFLTLTNGGMLSLTIFGLIWEQTAFIDWIGKMENLTYVYPNYASGDFDQAFSFSMGVLKMFFLCFMLYGSLGLVLFNLYAFQSGKGHTKNAAYYKSRLTFYSFMYLGHGLFPFLVQGTKIYIDVTEEGRESPLQPPVTVIGQPITHPEITISIGVLLTLIGMWGMLRGIGLAGNNSRAFQLAVGFGYFAYICCIVLTEFSIPGPAAAKSSMATVVFLNGNVMLAWLDEKARTVPEDMEEDYYQNDSDEAVGDQEQPLIKKEEDLVEGETTPKEAAPDEEAPEVEEVEEIEEVEAEAS